MRPGGKGRSSKKIDPSSPDRKRSRNERNTKRKRGRWGARTLTRSKRVGRAAGWGVKASGPRGPRVPRAAPPPPVLR